MDTFKLEDFTKGWLVGDFEPSLIRSKDIEVAVKVYKKHDSEQRHHHKIATEITIIASGKVMMNDACYGPGSIIRINPGEDTDFQVLTDEVVTMVIKTPSVTDDKYLGPK